MNSDFWKLIATNFFITAAMYMLIPTLPHFLMQGLGLTPVLTAVATSITGVGVFALGPFCSYSIQRFRRNKICIISIAVTAASFIAASYIIDEMQTTEISAEFALALIAARLTAGAFFGLSLIILNSTLIIDSCVSSKRTQANAISSWTHLLAIPTGMAGGSLTLAESNTQDVFYAASAACAIAIILIMSAKFPFKAPEETIKKCSLDRFIAKGSLILFLPTIFAATLLGETIVQIYDIEELAYMGFGCIAAISSLVLTRPKKERTAKFKIPAKHITISACTGYVILLISILLLHIGSTAYTNAGMACLGLGATFTLSSIHLCFIESADHCQRGSAESTYLLAIEFGIAAGIAIYFIFNSPSACAEASQASPSIVFQIAFMAISAATYFIPFLRKTKPLCK